MVVEVIVLSATQRRELPYARAVEINTMRAEVRKVHFRDLNTIRQR